MNTHLSPLAFPSVLRPLAVFALALSLFSITLSSPAQAEGFALYEWSARGIALGGATIARPKADASAAAYNPALMTKLPGTHIMAGMSTVTPDGKVDTRNAAGDLTTTNVKAHTWFIPHLYATQQLTDNLFLGFGQFSRFGLGFTYDENWPGNQSVYAVNLQTISFNPSLAIKATEAFSVAVGAELIYVNLDLKRKALVPTPLGRDAQIDVDINDAHDFGLAGNLGLHYQFDKHWSAGLTYRSPARVKARGDNKFTFDNRNDFNAAPPIQNAIDNRFKDGDATGVVTFPESVAFALAWSPTEKLSLEGGALWTRWSRFRNLDINFPDSIGMSHGAKDWSNSWRFNFGAEYDVTDWLTLRAGYVYDRSPMTDGHQDYLVPTSSRHIYSVGTGFAFSNWTIDATYAYIDITGRDYDNNRSTHVLNGRSKASDTHITSLSIGYHF